MTIKDRKANKARIAALLDMMDREDYAGALLALRDIDGFDNKTELTSAIKQLETAGAIVPKMSERRKEKTPTKLSDSEKTKLARRIFLSVKAAAKDLNEKNIGAALAKLIGAILNSSTIDIEGLSDYEFGPMYVLLLDAFDPAEIKNDVQIGHLYSHIRFVI